MGWSSPIWAAASLVLVLVAVPTLSEPKRWRALSCPTYCRKDVDPVCGSDGVIYKNDCEMRKRTCNRDVKSVDLESCTLPSGSKCEHKCDKDKDLVCGTDGRTYLNKCFQQVEYCERGIGFSHYGTCVNSTAPPSVLASLFPKEQLREADECPETCPGDKKRKRSRNKRRRNGPNRRNKEEDKDDIEFVCGSDGNVYDSECDMRRETCGQGVVSVDRRHCQTTQHCDSGCWRISRLTCGSDGKLYNNGCQMHRKNCGKHIFEVPVPYCLNKLYRTDCPLECEDEGEAVCGSDGNVYRSMCEMKKITCGYPLTRYERITSVDFSLCSPRASSCDKMVCSDGADDVPVCGNDGVTYDNACLLRKATCSSGVQQSHVGRCTDLKVKEKCPKKCPEIKEGEERDAYVCGSDGNVYKSECEMRRSTCGQRVTTAPRSQCQSTKYCDVQCPEEEEGKKTPRSRRGRGRTARKTPQMVCGSDGQFYPSECQMRKRNCGLHVYVSPISRCLSNFKFIFSGCGRVCPSEYDPVCGDDDKTYSNQCFMEMENCRARSLGGVRRKYFGKCGEPKQKARYYLYRK